MIKFKYILFIPLLIGCRSIPLSAPVDQITITQTREHAQHTKQNMAFCERVSAQACKVISRDITYTTLTETPIYHCKMNGEDISTIACMENTAIIARESGTMAEFISYESLP